MRAELVLLALSAIATILQAIVVSVSVIYLGRQVALTRKSVEHIERAARLDAYLNHRQLLTDINNVLVRDDQLLRDFGYSKTEIVAFMFLGYAELVFLQHKFGLVQRGAWRSHRTLAVKFVRLPAVADVWAKYKHEFLPDFIRFVDGQANEEFGPDEPP